MVISKNFNASRIESYLYGKMINVVSPNICITVVPPTLNSEWKSFVVIDVQPVFDEDSQAFATIFIRLYARPRTDGMKNLKEMSILEDKIVDIMNTLSSETYVFEREATVPDYDANIGWHYNEIQLALKAFC